MTSPGGCSLQLADGELGGEAIIDAEALGATKVPHSISRPPDPPDGGQPGLYGLGWIVNTEHGGIVTWAHSGAFSNGANTTGRAGAGGGSSGHRPGADQRQPSVGVPETIADAYLDLLLSGEAHTDEWFATWSERMAGVYGEPLDLGPEPDEPAPAAAPEAYEGTYTNAYVGDVEITAGDDGTLEMAIGPAGTTYALEDAATPTPSSTPTAPEASRVPREAATFEVVDGQAVSLTLSAMDGAGLGTLERARRAGRPTAAASPGPEVLGRLRLARSATGRSSNRSASTPIAAPGREAAVGAPSATAPTRRSGRIGCSLDIVGIPDVSAPRDDNGVELTEGARMPDQKVTTIRQSAEQAADLEAIARVEGVPVADVLRTAIARHIEDRRNDPEFRKRIETRLKEDEQILRKLADR
ncbi:MAG: hypothetical protein U5R31_00695 [Acidimicrobiia bacterium]|nr:hypothetical protein [Acidimicrobiia bacterium]